MPLLVARAFDLDLVWFFPSHSGSKYAIVFTDYLTKWVEAFLALDQTALIIAWFLVEELISCHGGPQELLSNRGAAFLSSPLQEVCHMMGTHKVKTTAYYPQRDGIVEQFNRILIEMLSKNVEQHGKDRNKKLSYVLFAYRTSVQESSQKSLFHLLYGQDPSLPTESVLSVPVNWCQLDLGSYQEELMVGLNEA